MPLVRPTLATRPSRPQFVEPTDDYQQRRYEISLAEAAAEFSVQSARAANVERVRTMLRDQLHEENRRSAIVRLNDEAEFFDIATPEEQEIDLHLPQTPGRSALRVLGAGVMGATG